MSTRNRGDGTARSPQPRRGPPHGALGGLLTLALAGCVVPAGPEREISGERIFQRHCARCHGDDGRGMPEVPAARDLTLKSYMDTRSDEQLRQVIMAGRPPGMPAFGGQFGEPSMKVLVAYVRGLSDPSALAPLQPPDAAVEQGAAGGATDPP